MANHRLPLARFTVLDLTAHRAGPTAARQLADWGAKVLKIDMPGSAGDALGGSRDGPDFQNLHRNKQAMTLNLKSTEGREVFFRLAATADVVIENYRSDVKHRLGIDYEAVRKVNPRIVYGSIAGFGQDGPYATRPGVDQIAQGMGGLMSITGLPGQGPVRVGIPIADLTAGIFLAQGILMALLDRDVTGEGQWVHTSLLEAQIFMLDFQAARWLIRHDVPQQAGNDHPTGAPTGMFKTADGHLNLAPSGNIMWSRFCRAIDRDDLIDDPRFARTDLRGKNRVALNAIIETIMRTQTSAHWMAVMDKAGIPCGPVNSIDQTFADPQVRHLGIARTVRHPRLGDMQIVGQPIHMSGTPQPDELRPTPDTGQDTDAVLADLGYSATEIAAMHMNKTV